MLSCRVLYAEEILAEVGVSPLPLPTPRPYPCSTSAFLGVRQASLIDVKICGYGKHVLKLILIE